MIMTVEMYMNELSIAEPAADIYIARSWSSEFVNTLRNAVSFGFGKVLRTQENFYDIFIAPDYPIRKWLNDTEVDKESQRYIKSFTTKAPYWEDLPNLDSDILSKEFLSDGNPALGLGAAYLMGALAVSFASSDAWNGTQIDLLIRSLEDDEFIEQIDTVRHASKPEHIPAHVDWLDELLKEEVENGEDLWCKREILFPSLIFCDSVEAQFQNLEVIYFTAVRKRLFELEHFCKNWKEMPKGTPFDADKLPSAKPQSKATLERYSKEHTILCPDKQNRIFSWHTILTPHARRIHFFPLIDNCQIIIGYFGPHKPTVKFHS
jgi:hypothetical protein